jgi:hypothetical protein
VLRGLTIDWTAEHFDEGCYRKILGNEACILRRIPGTDQHQLEAPPPDDVAAETRESGEAFASKDSKGFFGRVDISGHVMREVLVGGPHLDAANGQGVGRGHS